MIPEQRQGPPDVTTSLSSPEEGKTPMSSHQPPGPPPLPPNPSPRKSPGLAIIFSLLPGLGHIYLGLPQRGIAFFAAFLASLWLADHADLSGAVIGFIFFYAMIDAYQMATWPSLPETMVPAPQSKPQSHLALGLILIIAGALMLYSNFYPLDLGFLADWWPLALIFLGIFLLGKQLLARGGRASSSLQEKP